MRILSVVALCLCPLAMNGQSRDSTTYFDEREIEMRDSTGYHYYEVDSFEAGDHWTNSFYRNGKPRHVEQRGKATDAKDRVYYYPSGELMAKGAFMAEMPVGPLTIVYPDGKTLAELEFRKDANWFEETSPYKIRQYWDASGKQIVTNGNGTGRFKYPFFFFGLRESEGTVVNGSKHDVWRGPYGRGLQTEIYDKGVLIGGVLTIDGAEYEYTKFETAAQPKGGMQSLARYVGNNLSYPPSARKKKITGKVFVEFMVNKDGTISDVRVVSGFHPECDDEASRVVASFAPWNPGLQYGMPVAQRMVLPISFNIGK